MTWSGLKRSPGMGSPPRLAGFDKKVAAGEIVCGFSWIIKAGI
jgi:hypothetical protein